MKYREVIKTLDEYSIELEKVASPEILAQFKLYSQRGQRIQAIKILRQYKLLKS